MLENPVPFGGERDVLQSKGQMLVALERLEGIDVLAFSSRRRTFPLNHDGGVPFIRALFELSLPFHE